MSPQFYDLAQKLGAMIPPDQMREFQRALWTASSRKTASELRMGDRVEWEHKGYKHAGVITKFNPTTVGVLSDRHVNWKCSPNCLTKTTWVMPSPDRRAA